MKNFSTILLNGINEAIAIYNVDRKDILTVPDNKRTRPKENVLQAKIYLMAYLCHYTTIDRAELCKLIAMSRYTYNKSILNPFKNNY